MPKKVKFVDVCKNDAKCEMKRTGHITLIGNDKGSKNFQELENMKNELYEIYADKKPPKHSSNMIPVVCLMSGIVYNKLSLDLKVDSNNPNDPAKKLANAVKESAETGKPIKFNSRTTEQELLKYNGLVFQYLFDTNGVAVEVADVCDIGYGEGIVAPYTAPHSVSVSFDHVAFATEMANELAIAAGISDPMVELAMRIKAEAVAHRHIH